MLPWPTGVMACVPDCGACKYWNVDSQSCEWSQPYYTCQEDLDCGPDCGDCINCQCQDDDTECGACGVCLGATCDFLCDDPLPLCDEQTDQCVECLDSANCPNNAECCNGLCCDSGQACCDDLTCYDPDEEHCCSYDDGTVCNNDETCCSGTNGNTCCDPDGATCDGGDEPGIYTHCYFDNIDTYECHPLCEGFLCGWEEEVLHTTSATSNGCTLLLRGACVRWDPNMTAL